MKKIDKKGIVKLIILIVLLIMQIKAFNNSRANNIINITAQIIDSSGLLSDETSTVIAINEGDNGMALTLPEYLNTKKVNKYFVTKKEITETVQTESQPTEELTESTITEETSQTEEPEIETLETVEMSPGEKIYLTQEEIDNLAITLTVQYDTIEVNSQTLYNKKLIVSDADDYELLAVSGYMPHDTQIQAPEIDISNLETKILTRYPEGILIGNYDITLTSNGETYQPKNDSQTLTVEMTIMDESKKHYVLEVEEDTILEIQETEIKDKKIKITTDELKTYLVLEMQGDSNTYADENTSDTAGTAISVDGSNPIFEINDFESDKNYYLGLNYTEDMSKESSGKYTESNLKEVTINYYGYDYSYTGTEFVEPKIYDVTLSATARKTTTGTATNAGNRTYTRTDVITCTISDITALQEQYPGLKADSGWTMQMAVPNNNFSTYFSATNTTSANSSNGISVSISNNIITVSGSDASSLEGTSDTWSFTFSVCFSGNNRNTINNISYTTFTVNSFETTISIGDYTPYGTISGSELKTLVTYKKCVPVDNNGNVNIELIDNPFMNRPEKRGFNGWKTNDTRYSSSITTNTNTFVQELSTSASNITDSSGNYVINLYPDWINANVIFVSSSGSANNSGTSIDSPINNDWDNITTKLDASAKTSTDASSREVNIVVLINGELSVSGLTGPETPFTLTSLYDGTNYGSTNTYLNVGTTDFTSDSDLQLHHLYVASTRSYTSPSGTTDGTAAVTPCIYGNMYNVRIGRGVTPTNTANCTWGQIQGGYSNRSSSEYKLMVESGQYYTIQLYRAGNGSTATTANGTIIVGSDIERANNNNSTLKIYNRMASRTTSATATPYQSGKLVNMIIKSGTIGVDFFNNASTSDSSDRNYAGIYVGGHGNTGYDKGDRYLVVEGGNIANIIGGLSMDDADMFKTYMYVKDGNVINITGGAGYTHTYGDRIIQVSGGCIKYSISGGSNGVAASTTTNNGQLTGESLIYVGGTAQIGASYTIDANGNKVITETNTSETLYGVNAGCVCGGANGNDDYAGQTDASYIIIDGQAIVHNNVYGGGNYGVIGSADTAPEGAEVIQFTNETSNFAANTEYWVATSATGGYGLSVSGTSLANETLSTAMVPSDSGKWVFESASGSEYYLKNVSTGQYIYISDITGNWNYTATITLSTTDKTAFTVEGTNSKNVTYTYTVDYRILY